MAMRSYDRHCIICTEQFDGARNIPAFGVCNHAGVCSVCFLRMRSIIREFSCPICKTELEYVIVTNRDSVFQDYTIWGETIGPDFTFDALSRMFFPTNAYGYVMELRSHNCNVCGRERNTQKDLETHLKAEHNLFACHLCATHKHQFPKEQKYFTHDQLDRHLRVGDADGGGGHPLCQFCKFRVYDKQALYEHLTKEHYSCHLCEKQGILFKYYCDYFGLQSHFEDAHFLCMQPECLEQRFVVFANELELHSHTRSRHPDVKVPKAIQLHFPLRPSGHETPAHESNNRGAQSRVDAQGQWIVEELRTQPDRRAQTRQQNSAAQPSGVTPQAESKEDFPELFERGRVSAHYSHAHPHTRGVLPRSDDFPALGDRRENVQKPQWEGSGSGRHKQNKSISIVKPTGSRPRTHNFATAVAPAPTAAMKAYSNPDPWSFGALDAAHVKSQDESRGKIAKKTNAQAHKPTPGPTPALNKPRAKPIAQTAPKPTTKPIPKSTHNTATQPSQIHLEEDSTRTAAPTVKELAPQLPPPPGFDEQGIAPPPPGFDDLDTPTDNSELAADETLSQRPPSFQPKKNSSGRTNVQGPRSRSWNQALSSAGLGKPVQKTGISVVRYTKPSAAERKLQAEDNAPAQTYTDSQTRADSQTHTHTRTQALTQVQAKGVSSTAQEEWELKRAHPFKAWAAGQSSSKQAKSESEDFPSLPTPSVTQPQPRQHITPRLEPSVESKSSSNPNPNPNSKKNKSKSKDLKDLAFRIV